MYNPKQYAVRRDTWLPFISTIYASWQIWPVSLILWFSCSNLNSFFLICTKKKNRIQFLNVVEIKVQGLQPVYLAMDFTIFTVIILIQTSSFLLLPCLVWLLIMIRIKFSTANHIWFEFKNVLQWIYGSNQGFALMGFSLNQECYSLPTALQYNLLLIHL